MPGARAGARHHYWDSEKPWLRCSRCHVCRRYGGQGGGIFSYDDGATWLRFDHTPTCTADPEHREPAGLKEPPAPRLNDAQRRALAAIAGGDPTGGRIPWRGTTHVVSPATLDILTQHGLIEPIREDGLQKFSRFRFKHQRLTEAGRRLAEAFAARDVAE